MQPALSQEEKRDFVNKQIGVYETQLTQYQARLDDTLRMQAECNFIAEVTGLVPSCYDRSIISLNKQIEDIKRDLDLWTKYKQNHSELF